MSVLLIAAALAATASIIATGAIAYILLSFRRSGSLMASRVGQSPALVLAANEASRQRQALKIRAALRTHQRPRPSFAH